MHFLRCKNRNNKYKKALIFSNKYFSFIPVSLMRSGLVICKKSSNIAPAFDARTVEKVP